MSDYEPFIRCPACGHEDRETVDYPDKLRRDGDTAETSCDKCDATLLVTLSMVCEVKTELVAASPPKGTPPREPIRWDCAFGFHDLDELNRRYGAGRFIALGGPDTLYDKGPDRTGRTVVPRGALICEDANGEPVIVTEAPAPPSPRESGE